MTPFDDTAFLKPTHPKGDVMVFGKSPDLEVEDAKNGVARFGGAWRAPSYLLAYVRSAGILVKHGVAHNELDDIALPAFYMQRHALELLIKRFLSWLYEAAEYRSKLGIAGWTPSQRMKRDLNRSHDLQRLLDQLRCSSMASDFSGPPADLAALVEDIVKFEKSDTWSRYESTKQEEGVFRHIEAEVVVPLVEFQTRLESIVSAVRYRYDGVDTFESELYHAWEHAARANGDLD